MSDAPIIYLDHSAATPVSPAVAAAMRPYLDELFYNPSATYLAARKVHDALETARARVAHWLGTRPSEIIFTAGGTEANNLAIHGVMRLYPDANIVVGATEHEAVLVPAQRYDCRQVAVTSNGSILIESLQQQIDDKTVLVSIMYANNEIGTLQPLKKVAQIINEVRAARQAAGNPLPIYFHSDACQAGNYLDLHVSRLGVDLLTINGGKIYGPKQSGALYVKGGLQLQPLIDGGGQERGLRSGTENVAQAVGLAAALDQVQPRRYDEAKRLQSLQGYFAKQLAKLVPGAVLTGSLKNRLPNNIHLTVPGFDNERLLIQLDEQGIMAAAGSACSASNDEPSHVLRAIGLGDTDAQSSLRFTMGQMTTKADIDYTLKTLADITRH